MLTWENNLEKAERDTKYIHKYTKNVGGFCLLAISGRELGVRMGFLRCNTYVWDTYVRGIPQVPQV